MQGWRRDHGFTLVEIMAVLFIIGLVSAAIVLSMPEPKTELEKQAEQLTVRLNAMAQDSLVTGKVSAVGITQDGYALYHFAEGEWEPFQSEAWAGNYRISLQRDNVELELPEEETPGILFYPTAQSNAFEIEISDGGSEHKIISFGDNRVERLVILQ